MSATPRTDEMLYRDAVVPIEVNRRLKDWADFARQLETELAAAREEVEAVRTVNARAAKRIREEQQRAEKAGSELAQAIEVLEMIAEWKDIEGRWFYEHEVRRAARAFLAANKERQ